MNPEIKKLVNRGLELASTGRRDQEELNDYFAAISGRENVHIVLYDLEDEEQYVSSLLNLPYLGNKSAGLAKVVGLATEIEEFLEEI